MNTAVILAARKERDSEIPYPLKEFADGECLLGRMLSILQENSYSRILIVVGYRRELFERYRSEDVELVYNPEYEFTSSMASLAKCSRMLEDDFLLIDGDTFFERRIIERISRTERGNCMAVTQESGSGDECYVETRHGFVTKITKDIHRVCSFEGEMVGVTRIGIDTYRDMVSLWERSSNPYLGYEYVLMDVTDSIDRPFIHFPNLIWGDVDCKEDYRRLANSGWRALIRKENPFDDENIRAILSQIFKDKDISRAEISRIGGMSNVNFKVTVDGEEFVLRVPGNGSEGMVDRANEFFNSAEAAALGINPPLRWADPKLGGVKVSDYVKDAETLTAATIQRPENMRKVSEIYRTLHGARIRLKNEFNIFSEIEKYDRLMEAAGAEMYEGWESLRPRVMALEGYLNRLGVDLKPCHNDGLYENFLKAPDGRIYLIDWEYSGMNDPMADIAALFIEAGFTPENEDYLLEHYFQGEIPEGTRERILCYEVLWDYLWAQWTVIKEAKGDDFGTYGHDRFMRAGKNINKIEGFKKE